MDPLNPSTTGQQIKTETDKDKGQQPPPPPAPADQSSELEKLRKERDLLKKERDDLAAADEERKTAQLSEVDRLKKERDKANERADNEAKANKEGRKRSAVELELTKRGCVDLGMGYGAIPADALEVSDDGTVTGAEKAVEALAAAKGFLFKQPENQSSTTTGAGSTSASSGAGAKTIKSADLRSMSDEDFSKLERLVKAGKVRLTN